MVSERRSYVATVIGEGSSGDEEPPVTPVTPQNPTIQHADEFEDPLYLHITENANAILVSPPLTEHNYPSWSISMQMALEVKNKFGFADGSIPNPGASDSRFAMWKRCNTIVCSWILRSLSTSITESVLYLRNAADIWTNLKNRYSQTDPHKIAEIQNKIFRNTQGSKSVSEYFTTCKALWEQMNAMRPLPMCECILKCSCNLVNKIIKEKEDDQVIRFLEGLNEDFEIVKSNVLVLDPIPNMDRVFNMALKVERKINEAANQKSNELVHSNAVQNNDMNTVSEQNVAAISGSNNKRRFNNGGKSVPKYTFCGMLGHTVDKCYKKHGYPPGWVHKPRNKQNQDSAAACVNQAGDIGLSADQFQRQECPLG